jgi:translation initiation factor 2 subunit 3
MKTFNNMDTLFQPIINLGTLGSVSDGKSTLIEKLTGIKTQRHSSEKKRNITIKSGYANLKIWECIECNNLLSTSSNFNEVTCKYCENNCKIVHHLSFVDCPGHSELILTMMGSVSLMKGGIIIVSASESLDKKPQLIQHLLAAKLANITKLIICFNKLDLVSKELAIQRKYDLDELLIKLDIKPYIIIPTAFNKSLGINNILKSIMHLFPINEINNNKEESFFRITRSFDINKPGIAWSNISGGVLGGSLINGELNIGDNVEVRPGILSKSKDGKYNNQPIITKILSLESDNIIIENIKSGGLVAIGTDIDPYYCKNDMLSGNILGKIGTLPNVYHDLKVEYTVLDNFDGKWDPKNGDTIYLQIGNISCESRLLKFNNNIMNFQLIKPICIENNIKILVCKKIEGILNIVGYCTLIQ